MPSQGYLCSSGRHRWRLPRVSGEPAFVQTRIVAAKPFPPQLDPPPPFRAFLEQQRGVRVIIDRLGKDVLQESPSAAFGRQRD